MELQELSSRISSFANKHSMISTSLLSLQKITLFQSQSSDFTVHNKFTFMNYTVWHAITNFISPTRDYELNKLKQSTFFHIFITLNCKSLWIKVSAK